MRPIGHVGGALVMTAIVVTMLDDAAVLWFTAVTVLASVLPDIDLYLPYVSHQGVIHTYPVMFLVSITGGVVATGVAAAFSGGGNTGSERVSENPMLTFVLATGAMILGTFTHITLDAVAYRETFTGPPVEPLWPLTGWVPRINIFPPHAPMWNYGFFIVGVVLWLVAAGVARRRLQP